MKNTYKSKAFTLFALLGLSLCSFAQTSTFSTPGTTAWIVPAGVTGLNVDMQGGNGGRATGPNTGMGGNGGRVRCILAVTAGETLYIVVGGKGDTGVLGTSAPGGYNNTVATGGHCLSTPAYVGGGGGGSSEICSGGVALANRLVVAGAGGGGSSYTDPVRATSPLHTQGYNTTGDGSVEVTLICETPLAGMITGVAAICAGGSTLTLANATGSSYGAWSSTNMAVASVNATTGVVTPGVAGTAAISYTATTACGTTASTSVSLNVTPAPDAGTITGINNVCPGNTVTLANVATGGTWSSSSGAIASVNAATGVVAGIEAGAATISYNVTISGCSSYATYPFTVNSTAICNAGVKNVTGNETGLNIYPNPGRGVFTVSLASANNIETRFIITNMLGEKVKEIFSVTNNLVNVNLDAPAGVYFLSAQNAFGKWTEKITIIR